MKTEEDVWFNFPEVKPEPDRDIVGKDSEGNTHYVYLCGCCSNEWRCQITGSMIICDIVKWKYII